MDESLTIAVYFGQTDFLSVKRDDEDIRAPVTPPLGNFEKEMKELNCSLGEDLLEMVEDQRDRDFWSLDGRDWSSSPLIFPGVEEEFWSPTEKCEEEPSMTSPSSSSSREEPSMKENNDPLEEDPSKNEKLSPSEPFKSKETPSPELKADEAFVNWLKEQRASGSSITSSQVKDKVAELLAIHGRDTQEVKSKWFVMWHNRREERQRECPSSDSRRRKDTQNLAYPPSFKLEVAWYARRYSQYAAAKIFGVARRRIFDWMRQIPKLEELIAKGHMKKMTGRGPKNRDIDQALYQWYCLRKESGARPKSCHVQKKAREIYSANGYYDMKCSYGWFKRWSQRFRIQLRNSYDDQLVEWILTKFDLNLPVSSTDLQNKSLNIVRKEDPSFKASAGWASRFCRRHSDYLDPDFGGRKPLPEHLEERSNHFFHVLRQLLKEKNFDVGSMGCVDEVSLHFPPHPDTKKRDAFLLRVPGMKGAHMSVVLSACADGTLLPPMIVIRGEDKLTSNCRFGLLSASGIFVLIREDDATVTEQVMIQWLNSIWFKDEKRRNSSLLIADSYPAHTGPEFKRSFSVRGGCLAIIPSACSSNLQPLCRGIKAKFRAGIDRLYHNYAEKNKKNSSFKIESVNIVKWIEDIYLSLKEEQDLIRRSFIETKIVF